ncbi:hypothetical protein EQU24_12165 [Methylotuvimicrobium buryatense]|uniref:CRISPR system Cms protein Csm5 n=2 Tax=Methylotuvimicrobium buryatense TaxID=95641 RepID=A0A4P9UNG2_METBY|nr:hypothetical protein EQU24_12165 [Methylotuvimicrobium buryatense]
MFMTHFLNHYTLKYTPLSPIHIGADESYEPGNYVIDDEAGALYSFDSRAALAGLSDSDRQQLLAIVNGKPDDTMLTKVQSFFHNHREKLLAFAKPPIPVSSGAIRHYLNSVGKTKNREKNGRVINKLEIERTFFNSANGVPMLPGSSIKGAIRTAMLDSINNGQSTRHKKHKDLQEELLGGSFQTDPMRLILIGDASWQGNENKPACQVQFAVNRKREPVEIDGKLLDSSAEKKGLYQLMECITHEHYQGFSGSLTLHITDSINKSAQKLPLKDLHWSIGQIAHACNKFYKTLLEQEISDMKKRNYLDKSWLTHVEQLFIDRLLKRLDDGEAFLLRVGKHSGGEALTLNGVRSIRINNQKKKPDTWENQPKTWWLAADDIGNRTNLLPFGWLLVEIDPKTPDSQLQNWLERGNQDVIDWLQRQSAKQNALKQQAELRQQQEEARKQAEQQRSEEIRLQQETEQQRLAALSPIDREVEEFLKPFQQQEHDTRLLQALESDRWQGEDAKSIAQKIKELMVDAGKWLPDFEGTNKQKMKLKQRSLKVLAYLQD